MPSWPPCRSPGMTGMASGTTPSPVQGHTQRPRNSASGPKSVLRQRDNPDRISLAAHGMREVMEKLYVYIDVPVPAKPPSMKSKVQALRQEWMRVAGEAEQAAEI